MSDRDEHVTVRTAGPADTAAIDSLTCYLDDFHARARPDFYRTPTERPRGDDFLRTLLDDPGQNIFVGVRAGRVVGYVHVLIKYTPASPFQVERQYGLIDALAVLPEAQHRGIGRTLVETALDWLASQGLRDTQVSVHAFNDEARQLYENMGFKPSVTTLRLTG
jgi:ribosomal protein S18 acetylase RimI-like enzyme